MDALLERRGPNVLLDQIYATRTVEDSRGNRFDPFPVAISYNEGRALYRLARKARARRILEVGMGYGISTLFLCQALRDNGGGVYAAVDPLERTRWRSIGLRNLQNAGLEDLVTLHEAPSYEVLPQLLRERERYGLIFIDGAHQLDYVFVDAFYADKLLEPEGFLVFDDVWARPVARAAALFCRPGRYRRVPGSSGPHPSPLWRLLSQSPWFLRALAKNPRWFFGGGRGSYWWTFQKMQDDFLPRAYTLANRDSSTLA